MQKFLAHICFLLMILPNHIFAQKAFNYTSPVNNAKYVSLKSSIILGCGEKIDKSSLSNYTIKVNGTKSGKHLGNLKLSDNEKILIFTPFKYFSTNEVVKVNTYGIIKTITGEKIAPISLKFITTSLRKPIHQNFLVPNDENNNLNKFEVPSNNINLEGTINLINGLPSDLPSIRIDSVNNPAPGDIFISDFPYGTTKYGFYLTIYDNSGNVVKYKKLPDRAFDFKVEPNGNLTYYTDSTWFEMDTSFTVIDSFKCGNGYTADPHDFELLPNGHALLIATDTEPVDMSKIVDGGDPNALVIGSIIQELDNSKNVIFQWRSWDHIPITDSYEDLTNHVIDYLHMNSVDFDTDGNLLVSGRHVSMIWKINRSTGDIMWRLGGKENQFTFINEHQSNAPTYFSYQHDVRRIANGDITLFDNGNQHIPNYSRAVEYKLDEENKTATLVWDYRHNPDIYGNAMGSVQRLPNGNTLIGWGRASATGQAVLTEIHPDKSIALELFYPGNLTSYRAYKFPWKSNQPVATVALSGLLQGNIYAFNQGNNSTGVSVKFDSLSNYDTSQVTIEMYDYSPDNPKFISFAPSLISEHFKLSSENIGYFKGEFHINLADYPKVLQPSKTVVYSRESDSLVFQPLPTSFDSTNNELIFLDTVLGDYAFGIPQKIDSVYSPVPISPPNGKIVNGNKPVELFWGIRGIVNYSNLQISTDSLFNNIVVDTSNIKSTYDVTSALQNDTEYYWRSNSVNQSGISEWSKPYLFYTASPFISVNYPKNGTLLFIDSTYIIRWQTNVRDTLKVELLRDSGFVTMIDSPLVSLTNAYAWTVPSSLPSDSTYSILITSISNKTLYEQSLGNFTIKGKISDIQKGTKIVRNYNLYQNYPNPFNPSTVIKYTIPQESHIEINIFNILGQKIETLVNKIQNKGIYSLNWNAENLSSGVYFFSIQAKSQSGGENFHSVKKMILLK